MNTNSTHEVRICQWQVSFNDSFTEKDALLASKNGEFPGEVHTFSLPFGTIIDLDSLRGFKSPVRSRALLLTIIYAEFEGDFIFGMGVDWWFTSFINGEAALDLGDKGNGGEVTSFSHFFKMHLKKGANTFAALTRCGGASWAFTMIPLTENILSGLGTNFLMKYYRNEIKQYRGLCTSPWLFNPSCNSIKIGVAFYPEVISGVRFREKAPHSPWQEKWSSAYGQKEPRTNHIFELEALKADTLYEYEVLRLNEEAPAKEILAKGEFRTLPGTGVEHSFFALSDMQTIDSIRKELTEKFIKNGNVKNVEFFTSLGDISSEFGDFIPIYFDSFLSVIKDQGIDLACTMVKGNHEFRGELSQYYSRFFGRPYYSFRRGDVFYFVLDTGEDKDMHAAEPHLYTVRTELDEYMEEQRKWLLQEVEKEECKKAKYHLVLAHAAPFAWVSSYYAEKIAAFAAEAFYGKNPKCKLDLWLCGDVHCPFRFDPVSGEVYGGLSKKNELYKDYVMGEFDRENICFPVYINSGPSCSNVDFSMTRVDIKEEGINLMMQDPDGNVLDDVFFRKEGGLEVKSTTFHRYHLQQELAAKGIETPPRPKYKVIPWETIPFVEVEE